MSMIPSLESCSHGGRPSRPVRNGAIALERLEERLAPAASRWAGSPIIPSGGSGTTAPTSAALPLSRAANTQFVLQLYHDLLGRLPGIPELGYWNAMAERGLTSGQVAAGVAFSPEQLRNEVAEYYEDYLGREASAAELDAWVSRVPPGTPGREIESMILRSDEFYFNHSESNADWINGLYHAVLDRSTDPSALVYWNRLLENGTPRDLIINALLHSREARERLVTEAFQTYLRRAPDANGLSYGLRLLAAGHSPRFVVTQLVSSREYTAANYTSFPDPNTWVQGQPDPLKLATDGPAGGVAGDGGNNGGNGQDGPKGNGSGTGSGSGGTGGTGGTGGPGSGKIDGPGSAPGGSTNWGGQGEPPNINASNDNSVDHVEMSIATNPTNPDNIVIFTTTVTFNGNFCDAFISFDGGRSWQLTRFDQSIDGIPGQGLNRFDPHVIFDDDGRLYVAYGVTDGSSISNVVVGRSADGGRTFATTLVAQDPFNNIFNDKWLLAAGPAPDGSGRQNVYIAWTQFIGNNSNIVISGSIDGGVTFSSPARVSDAAQTKFATPGVGPNGEVYVSFMTPTQLVIDVATTFNGTAASFNFGADRPVATLNFPMFVRTIPPNNLPTAPPQPNRGIATLPVLAVDRLNNKLYIAYTDVGAGRAFPDTDIFMVSSEDGGRTWRQPVRVNDDSTATTQFNPWPSVDQSGCVGIAWRDPRNNPANGPVDVFLGVSTDGQTFGPNVQVTEAPSDHSGAPSGLAINDFAEYDGLSFVEGRAYLAWSDNRGRPNQEKDVFFDAIVTECGSVPDDAQEPNETSDRATFLGSARIGFSATLTDLNINLHPTTRLPDYDWYRVHTEAAGTLRVTIGPGASNLELQLFTRDSNNTLIPLAVDTAPGRGARTITYRLRAGQDALIEVKGRNTRPGRFGQGSYQLDVNYF